MKDRGSKLKEAAPATHLPPHCSQPAPIRSTKSKQHVKKQALHKKGLQIHLGHQSRIKLYKKKNKASRKKLKWKQWVL